MIPSECGNELPKENKGQYYEIEATSPEAFFDGINEPSEQRQIESSRYDDRYNDERHNDRNRKDDRHDGRHDDKRGGYNEQSPSSPPPRHIPQRKQGVFAVDPGAIRGCLYRFTYVWIKGGRGFWMYPTYVGRDSVAGYRWTGFGWTYAGIDLRLIESFTCV